MKPALVGKILNKNGQKDHNNRQNHKCEEPRNRDRENTKTTEESKKGRKNDPIAGKNEDA